MMSTSLEVEHGEDIKEVILKDVSILKKKSLSTGELFMAGKEVVIMTIKTRQLKSIIPSD